MKKIYILLASLCITFASFAQAPEKMSYQAVVRGAANAAVASQVVGMQISVLQTTATGTAVYVETQTPTTNAKGLLSIFIGAGTPLIGTFASIDWSAGPYFIKTEIDPVGGNSYTITGTSQLLSVPYALYAKNGLPPNGSIGQVLTVNASGNAEWTAASIGEMYYKDADNDGFGDINSKVLANETPTGYVNNNTDCDDNDVTVNNGNTVWYLDADADGYAALSIVDCNPGAGYTTTVLPLGDCDDYDPARNPGASEIAGDGIDNNCNGAVDEAEIGQFIEGGIVFWVDPTDNFHGLVCAIEDQVENNSWGPDIITGAIASAIGSGSANTTTIIAALGSGSYSASIARAYTGGGFLDWFLPSKGELNEMYINRAAIDATAIANGGAVFNVTRTWTWYSSSSESSGYDVWAQTFFNADQFPIYRGIGHDVRAVRAF